MASRRALPHRRLALLARTLQNLTSFYPNISFMPPIRLTLFPRTLAIARGVTASSVPMSAAAIPRLESPLSE
jgi:hypothetical protein